MTQAQHEHGGNVYAAMRQSASKLDSILDFSANINPLGLAPSVRKAIDDAIPGVIHYPDPDGSELKERIAAYYQVDPSLITLGNGAVELLYLLCHIRKPRRVLLPAPTFSEYARAVKAAGGTIDHFMLHAADNFVIDRQRLLEQLPRYDMLFLCNPNNPTGAWLGSDDIREIVMQARQYNTHIVVDESFVDFFPEDRVISCRSFIPDFTNVSVLCSLTKFLAIPGLRLGFLLADPAFTSQAQHSKDPWNVNNLAQAAGVAGLSDREYHRQTREVVGKAKQELFAALANIPGVHPFPPSVNYMLLHIAGTGMNAPQLRSLLAKRGILVRDCSNFPGLSDEYIRVAVKLPEQNKILAEELRQVIMGYHNDKG